MRIVPFGPQLRVGALLDERRLIDLNFAFASLSSRENGEPLPYADADLNLPSSLDRFLAAGKRAVANAARAMEYVRSQTTPVTGPSGEQVVYDISTVRLAPPLPGYSSRIFCAGANFASHQYGVAKGKGETKSIDEIRKEIRAKPFWGFYKLPQTVMGNGDTVSVPKWVRFLDYEVELAAFIGKEGRNVTPDEAKQMVAGYSCFIDWSVRDRFVIRAAEEVDSGTYNFALQKNLPGASLGPYLVMNEVNQPYDLTMTTRVNGRVRQSGNTGEMSRRFEEMISYLSKFIRLLPGDIIASGTCAGTALDSSEPNKDAANPGDCRLEMSLCLKHGDLVQGSIGDLGVLENRVEFKEVA